MISAECESYVRTLLASGEYTRRAIAKRAGVSRGTVDAIAGGRRERRPLPAEVDGDEQPAIVARCATCGARTVIPCLACFVRWIWPRLGKKR